MPENLTWLPAWRIGELIAKREVSPVEVTDHFLGRMEEHEPTLHAFLHVDTDDVRRQAKAAADRLVAGGF